METIFKSEYFSPIGELLIPYHELYREGLKAVENSTEETFDKSYSELLMVKMCMDDLGYSQENAYTYQNAEGKYLNGDYELEVKHTLQRRKA